VHREDQAHRDWARNLKARSEHAADMAEIASLSVVRAYEVLDKALEEVSEAKAKTAAARERAWKMNGAAVTAVSGHRTAFSNDRQPCGSPCPAARE
jgi:hypothetical protein